MEVAEPEHQEGVEEEVDMDTKMEGGVEQEEVEAQTFPRYLSKLFVHS